MKTYRFTKFILSTLIVLSLVNSKPAFAQNFSAQAAVPLNIRFEPVVTGLNNPLFVTHAGDGSGRLFIVQNDGYILISKNGDLNLDPFLDINASSALRESRVCSVWHSIQIMKQMEDFSSTTPMKLGPLQLHVTLFPTPIPILRIPTVPCLY